MPLYRACISQAGWVINWKAQKQRTKTLMKSWLKNKAERASTKKQQDRQTLTGVRGVLKSCSVSILGGKEKTYSSGGWRTSFKYHTAMLDYRTDVYNSSGYQRGDGRGRGDTHPTVQALLARTRHASRTPGWFAARAGLVTATNVATILGQNPYDTRAKLLYRKKHNLKAEVWQPAVDYGVAHEAVAGQLYTEVTGVELVQEDVGLLVGVPGGPAFIGATPDFVARAVPIIVEIKTLYRRVSDHTVPKYYYAQLQTQMAVTGLPLCHFVQYKPPSFGARGVLDIIPVAFDAEWWETALPDIERFHQDLQGEVPEPPPKRQRKLGQKKPLVAEFAFVD